MNPLKIRRDELQIELLSLILIKHEHERTIEIIQKQITELDKLLCGYDGHIWKEDKYNLECCGVCYTYRSVKKLN